MGTNPVIGFLKCLGLFVVMKVKFDDSSIGREAEMWDGQKFTVFRRVVIERFGKKKSKPKALFIIRFKPADMGIEENIRFSKRPMMIFMGFKGFRSKYWTVDYDTGICQGIYEWDSMEDAINYSKSIAVTFMTKRSVPGSVDYRIADLSEKNYQTFYTLS